MKWNNASIGANCEMLIYNVGSASRADRETLQRLKALDACSDVPLVIISDSECREEIISALNIGAQSSCMQGRMPGCPASPFSFHTQ
jgi:DNA-binding NarL/FixJ family response regulator